MGTQIDLVKLKRDVLNILSPIKPTDESTIATPKFLFTAERSEAGRKLEAYYLVYFLLNDLLGFKNLGRFEKIAWSFPIDFNGRAFLVEYRKMGLGVFVQNKENDERSAEIITYKINAAINKAQPYFNYLATQAVNSSKFNVLNNNQELFKRFEYLLSLYSEQSQLVMKMKGDFSKNVHHTDAELNIILKIADKQGASDKASWLVISCIEAFFSWTEHLFIHLAIIANGLSDGDKIAGLIGAEWKEKFNAVFPNQDKVVKSMYDDFLVVRQQLRNFVAHGSFGKNGNAFFFHSSTGAVPVLMNHDKPKNRFSLTGSLAFKDEVVIELIEKFIKYLWEGPLAPAMVYTQKWRFPTILTSASNGEYSRMMTDRSYAEEFMGRLAYQMDSSANMDW